MTQPRPRVKLNPIRQTVVSSLIATQKSTTTVKVLIKDENGKEDVQNISTTRDVLRYPLAQNVSEQNVDRLAERWLK